MNAWLSLRHTHRERQRLFKTGLERHGYKIKVGTTIHPGRNDIFCCWNRIGTDHNVAKVFENHGLPVLVAENAAWGSEFVGDKWYSLGRTYHNLADANAPRDNCRWDSMNVDLKPFRNQGETVILPQRGIGSHKYVMPRSWTAHAHARYGGRIRPHPGKNNSRPLEDDLKRAGLCVTWGSGAAIKALMMGVPVIAEMPHWIGTCDNTDESRLNMLRRLAWQQFRLSEIESGFAFDVFLSTKSHG